MDEFPGLETERLVLREFRASDAQAAFDILSQDRVTRYVNIESLRSVDQAEEVVKARINLFKGGQGIRWGLAPKDQVDVIIGSCGYYNLNEAFYSCEMGYELHPKYWRQGLMQEALATIIGFGFGDRFFFRLNRIEALTYLHSEPSIALLRKLGFKEEGIRREYAYWKHQFHDLRCFSLLRRDWAT